MTAFTISAKRALERAGFEAFQRGHNYLDTEHLLFGFVAEEEGVVARVLAEHGVDTTEVSERVMELLRVGSEVEP